MIEVGLVLGLGLRLGGGMHCHTAHGRICYTSFVWRRYALYWVEVVLLVFNGTLAQTGA